MKRRIAILFGLATFGLGAFLRAETDEEVEAHKLVLDLTGAFSNDGFKLRDGHWTGTIKPGGHALVAVNLYAGNQYWFSVGIAEPLKKVGVSLYDETGNQMTTENFSEGDKAAAGFAPENSGQYFVSVDSVEDQEGSFCLVYSYK
jgi:hypothetical protein